MGMQSQWRNNGAIPYVRVNPYIWCCAIVAPFAFIGVTSTLKYISRPQLNRFGQFKARGMSEWVLYTLTAYAPTAKHALALLRLCTTFRGHYSAFNSYSQLFENHSFQMTSQRFIIDSIGQYLRAS